MLALAACSGEAPVTTARFPAFGALTDLSLVRVGQPRAEQAAALIREDFAILEQEWLAADGPMARVNRLLPTGEPFVAPPSALPLIRLSQTLSARSGGRFNPATGRLTALWGFDRDDAGSRPPPDAAAIARLAAANPQMSEIRIAGLTLQGANPALSLDFQSIARGAAIDLAVERLRQLGIRDAQVQVGGQLRAIGDRSGQPWRVPIRRASGAGVLAVIAMRGDESMATVSAYDRSFMRNGVAYPAILDPRTGWPATAALAATVLQRDAASAQAAATALFVAGPESWVETARTLGLRYALLIDTQGRVRLSPELRARIELVDTQATLVPSEPLGADPADPAKP